MRRGEFDLIRAAFAPLSDAEQGLGLRDDAARIINDPGHDLIATADILVAGVHFGAADPADAIARKALRVNLSDVAAMGALPISYLLSLALPKAADDDWIDRFAAALADDNRQFGIVLAGGDTVATPGPLTVNVTAFGQVREGAALRRSGARAGDDIYVSGTVGDAALALAAEARPLPGLDDNDLSRLRSRLLVPEPRVALGPRLVGLASACIDVSDGLAADLGHICEESGAGADIRAASVPLSRAASKAVAAEPEHFATVLSGGDDYELLFTAPPALRPALAALAAELDLALSVIGAMSETPGVRILGPGGEAMALEAAGYRHF